jgi:hypothetical protein
MTLLASVVALSAVTCMVVFAIKRKSLQHLAIASYTKISIGRCKS